MSLLVRFLEWLAVMVSLAITLAGPVLVMWIFSELRLFPAQIEIPAVVLLSVWMCWVLLDVLFWPVFRAFILRK